MKYFAYSGKYRISDLFNGAIPVDEFNLEVKLNSIEIIMVMK